MLKTIGLGPVPIDAFPRQTPARFYGDWLDTEESQRLLQFQTRDINNQLADMKHHFRLISPVVTRTGDVTSSFGFLRALRMTPHYRTLAQRRWESLLTSHSPARHTRLA